MKIAIWPHLRARRAGLCAQFPSTPLLRGSALACATLVILAVPQGPAAAEGTIVDFKYSADPGTIVVRTGERRLYLVLGSGKAIRYKVGVGRQGRQWIGESVIDGKYIEPNWAPPAEIKRNRPNVPDLIPGGSPNNPLGVAAMTLSGGQYAIHGTNSPELDRRLRLLRLHPDVQRGHHRPLQARRNRLAGPRDSVDQRQINICRNIDNIMSLINGTFVI